MVVGKEPRGKRRWPGLWRAASSLLICLAMVLPFAHTSHAGSDRDLSAFEAGLSAAPRTGTSGFTYGESARGSMIQTAQLLKEITEEEARTAEFINAARNGDLVAVKKYLGQGMGVNVKNESGNTALMEACAGGHPNVVTFLLDKGADFEAKNNIGETALRKAIRNKQYAIVDLFKSRKLLKWDGDAVRDVIMYADAEDIKGFFRSFDEKSRQVLLNMLPTTCRSGKPEVVKFFLDQGADPNQHDGLPLYMCSGEAPVEAVKILLARGAKINLPKKPALHYACSSRKPEVAKLLLKKGANVNGRDEDGKTALIASMSGGAALDPIVKILLENGADVNLKNNKGYTALHLACGEGRTQAIRMLLDRGANVNPRSDVGSTPLMIAAIQGATDAVELLIQRGADLNAKTQKGMTALNFASRRGHKKVEAILKRHGAK